MRNIVNIIMKAAIIIGTSFLFPEYIVCDGARALVLAIICIMITGAILGIAMLAVTFALATVKPGIAVVVMVVTCMISGIVQLAVATHFVSGFEIHGIATYIIMAILMAVFSVGDSK